VPPFRETQRYIKKVLAYQNFYKHGLLKEAEIIKPKQEVANSL
jgi:soluble lytic murein transglycosylase-like protein